MAQIALEKAHKQRIEDDDHYRKALAVQIVNQLAKSIK